MESEIQTLKNYELLKHIKRPNKNKSVFTAIDCLQSDSFETVFVKGFSKTYRTAFVELDIEPSDEPRELYFLKKLQNRPFVPKLIDYFTTESNAYVVMEDLSDEWEDLYVFTESPIEERKFQNILYKLINVLQELSSIDLHYLDIKPENAMINTKTFDIKLIDFEYAFQGAFPKLFRLIGSEGYVSPEVYETRNFDIKASQVFSLGCLMFSCMEILMPFESIEDARLNLMSRFSRCSPDLMDLIQICVLYNPNDRIKFDDLLKHKYFENMPLQTTQQI